MMSTGSSTLLRLGRELEGFIAALESLIKSNKEKLPEFDGPEGHRYRQHYFQGKVDAYEWALFEFTRRLQKVSDHIPRVKEES